MARKTLAQEHNELSERFAALTADHATAVTSLADAIAARDAAVSRAAALAETNTKLGEEIAGHLANLATVTAARDYEKTRADALAAEVEKVKSVLAIAPVPDTAGAEPVADGGAAPQPAKSRAELLAEYDAIPAADAKARAKFRADHPEILKTN